MAMRMNMVHRGIDKHCPRRSGIEQNDKGIDKHCNRSCGIERYVKQAHVPYTKDQLKGMFWRHDKNNDGRLSRQELEEAFGELGAFIPFIRAYLALRSADANGDGFISGKEFEDLVDYAFERHYEVH